MRKLDLTRNTHDHRDLTYAEHGEKHLSLPRKVSLRSLDVPIWDQGDMGSCTGHGWAALRDFLRKKLFPNAKISKSSILFIYGAERDMDGDFDQDAGASIRDGAQVLTNLGCVQDSDWPYIDSNLYKHPPESVYVEALKHKAGKYLSLASLQEIKSSIAAGYPVVAGFEVFSSFDDIGSDGLMPVPKSGESDEGGHCIEIIGYDDVKRAVEVRNSWGTDWGDEGYFWMSYDVVNNPDMFFDPTTLRI